MGFTGFIPPTGFIPTIDAAGAGTSRARRRREPAPAPHGSDMGSSFTTVASDDYYFCSDSDVSAEGGCGRGSAKSSMTFRTQHDSLFGSSTRKSDGNLQSLSASSPSASSGDERQVQVKFGTVEIRLYPFILGDSPSTSMGVPLSIDWAHFPEDTTSTDLEDYESRRVDDNARKSRDDLRLPRLEREAILLRSGLYTRTQLLLAEAALLEEKWHQEFSRKSREREVRLEGMLRPISGAGRRITSLVRRRAKKEDLVAKHGNAASSDRSRGFRRDSFGRLLELDLSK